MARVQASARLSSKSQVVMPKVVRERIGVGPGDLIVFEVRDDEAVVRRAPRVVQDDPFAVFTQWASPADAEAHDAFERWDVVAVPFPYVELLQTKRRPAVVVSGQRWLKAHGLPWVAMVTSAVHAP